MWGKSPPTKSSSTPSMVFGGALTGSPGHVTGSSSTSRVDSKKDSKSKKSGSSSSANPCVEFKKHQPGGDR